MGYPLMYAVQVRPGISTGDAMRLADRVRRMGLGPVFVRVNGDSYDVCLLKWKTGSVTRVAVH